VAAEELDDDVGGEDHAPLVVRVVEHRRRGDRGALHPPFGGGGPPPPPLGSGAGAGTMPKTSTRSASVSSSRRCSLRPEGRRGQPSLDTHDGVARGAARSRKTNLKPFKNFHGQNAKITIEIFLGGKYFHGNFSQAPPPSPEFFLAPPPSPKQESPKTANNENTITQGKNQSTRRG